LGAKKEPEGIKTIAQNRRALRDFSVLETLEAGIELQGSEVKSLKEGRISLKESFAEIKNGEAFLLNCHISPYEPASRFNHDPIRPKRLLLHRREIKRLTGKIKEKGLTLVPTKVILNEKGRIKVEVSLAKGKKAYEKKEAIKERDRNRELRAVLKHARR
jgi:SsrA-binding protein